MRRYYLSGTISLFLLPILLGHFIIYEIATRDYAIDVNFPSENSKHAYSITDFRSRVLSQGSYTEFKVVGDECEDALTLKKWAIKVNSISSGTDTLEGGHMIISGRAKYQSYVRIFDICNVHEGLVYGIIEDSFWVFKPKRDSTNYLRIPCFLCNDVIPIERIEQIGAWDKIKKTYLPTIKPFWLPTIPYLIMVVLTGFGFYFNRSFK